MPITYSNRKGDIYTLYRERTVTGTPRYHFARKSKGEPVEEIPPGYQIRENPNGRVWLVKARPERILPEEVAAVEAALAAHPHAHQYRLLLKPDRIEIHANKREDILPSLDKMAEEGLEKPVSKRERQRIQGIDERLAHFVPVLRFIVRDARQRSFRLEGRFPFGFGDSSHEWLPLAEPGPLAELAATFVPALGAETFMGLDASAIVPPWSDVASAEGAAPSPRRYGGQPASVHQLKVTLLQSRPPIWRQVVVPSDTTLGELHRIIQAVMEWGDEHLHEFRLGNVSYGNPYQLEDLGGRDERKVRLDQIAPLPKFRLRYLYDFGDSWEHEILVEAIGPPAPDTPYPLCLAGKRAGPPEDSGGVWRYSDLVALNEDPNNDPEALEYFLEWLGEPFDPEAFDLAEINRRLAKLR